MAIRIRKDGRILCAAMHPKEPGDTYIDDGLHYELSVIKKVIGTEPMKKHEVHGQWWWMGNVPDGIEIAEFYKKPNEDQVSNGASQGTMPKEQNPDNQKSYSELQSENEQNNIAATNLDWRISELENKLKEKEQLASDWKQKYMSCEEDLTIQEKENDELEKSLKEKEDEIRELKDLVERWSASFDKLVESGKERDESLDRMIYLNKQLSKYKALAEGLMNFTREIREWELPETGKFWDEEKTKPTSYETEYGSNGVREYFRNKAAKVISETLKEQLEPPTRVIEGL